MTSQGGWGRRLWWAGPVVLATVVGLMFAAVVVGPTLADTVSAPAGINIGPGNGPSPRLAPPAVVSAGSRQTRAPAADHAGTTPVPRPHGTPEPAQEQSWSADAAAATAGDVADNSGGVDPAATSSSTPAPPHVVAPSRPVVESPDDDDPHHPGGHGDGGGDDHGDD